MTEKIPSVCVRACSDLRRTLHLARVLGAKNDHLTTLEVDLDGRGRGHAGGEAVRRELTGVVDGEIGLAEVGELLGGRTDEHVVHEEGVVRSAADDADFDSVLGLPASEAVEHVDVLSSVQVVDSTLPVDLERVLVHLDLRACQSKLALAYAR